MALYSEAGLPASYVALPFADWQVRPEWPAVSLANTDPVEDLAPHVGRLRLIILDFPKFSDGRAYSQARLLRGRMGYRGELRATGGALAKARTLFSVVYQPAEDDQVPAALRRLEHGNAAAS